MTKANDTETDKLVGPYLIRVISGRRGAVRRSAGSTQAAGINKRGLVLPPNITGKSSEINRFE